MLKEIILKYIKAFENKDVQYLSQIFDTNIELIDWEISAKGIHDVLKANQNIFNALESIKVTIINIYEISNVVIIELNIEINSTDSIKVVDIIEFNSVGKICSIRAFKG